MISEEMKTTIRTLYEKGYNKSQISRMLQIDRKTVRAKLKESDEGLSKKKIRPTILDPYKEYIHSIKEDNSKVYMVLNTQPGEEAQVDFGYIGFLNIRGHFH